MSYYDMPQDEMKTRGIDYDLGACLENNPQGAFELTDIDKVLAVWEGENDGDDHHPSNAGLGHMLNLIDGTYMGNSREVYESLMKQLADGKNQTWREEHDKLEGL